MSKLIIPADPSLGLMEYLDIQDTKAGILRVYRPIEDGLVQDCLTKLSYMEKIPEIDLRIMSPGGGVYQAFALYDKLKMMKVNALVEGFAASAAVMILLQAATRRRAHINSTFLLHEPSRWAWEGEKTSALKDAAKEMERMTLKIEEVIAQRSGRSLLDVKQLIERKEVWMSPDEAKDWGLIDEIVE